MDNRFDAAARLATLGVMTATPDIERRVSQHHDDIAALYDLQIKTNKTVRSTSKAVKKIAETQQEHGMRLTRLEEAAEDTNQKLEATNQKV
ncbi:MAG TPA: hypothetical protein DGG94_19540, partial [Micromonosporaceae bacterium]|nr:hypothetical protein [Micromonosporaceae bacterium]